MKPSRLQVGVDVPWVTSWTAEAFLGVRPCATVGGRLAVSQAERPGQGRPQYSRNHLVRQRRSVAEMLCPMCGQPTAADDRWTQTAARTTAEAMRGRGLAALLPRELPGPTEVIDAGAIAPLHLACAERSMQQCPHLHGMQRAEIRRFPQAWVVAPLMLEAKPRTPPLPGLAQTRSVPVVSFLQIFGVALPAAVAG